VKAVYGLYPDGHAAQQAVNRLRAAGIPEPDITILSARPMEEYEFGRRDKGTWMWWFACLGGALGMSAGYGLSWLTETSWPIDVGGLPIFAWWPNLIIMFELTMLGAIVATAAALIASALVPSRGRTLYDSEVTDGQILVGVENPGEAAVHDIEVALSAPPGARVKSR